MVNDGTELRINRIRHSDLSDYTCVARNGEGRIHHTVKVVIAGDNVYSDDHDDGDDYGFWIYIMLVKMSPQVKLMVMMWGGAMIMTEDDDDWNWNKQSRESQCKLYPALWSGQKSNVWKEGAKGWVSQ